MSRRYADAAVTLHLGPCGGTVRVHRWVERDTDGRPCAEYSERTCNRCGAEVDERGLSEGWATCSACGETVEVERMSDMGDDCGERICEDCAAWNGAPATKTTTA